MVKTKRNVPPKKALVHISAICVVILAHAVNITLPWTLGVFMVRDFMGLNRNAVSTHRLGNVDTNIPLQSTQNLPSETPENVTGLSDSNSTEVGQLHEAMLLEDSEKHLEHLIGYRAGILSAAFSLSQVLTSFLWGNLANKAGTKPLIQISQLSAVAANLALGLAPTYSFALAARFVSGLLSSITGAFKTNVARSFDVKHQPRIFGYTMSCWALGSILGPGLGALVAEPCTSWDSFRSSKMCEQPTALLRRFPFLLPFGATAVLAAIAFIVAAFALSPEDSVRIVWPAEDDQAEPSEFAGQAENPDSATMQANDVETTSLLHSHTGDDTAHFKQHDTITMLSTVAESAAEHISLTRPKLYDAGGNSDADHVQLTTTLSTEIPLLSENHSVESETHEHSTQPGSADPTCPSEAEDHTPDQIVWWKDRDVKMRICGYGSLALLFSIIGESLPIFSALSLKSGGLGYSSTEFAIPAGAGGLSLMISSTLIYPRLNKALGNQRTVIVGLAIMTFVTAGYPCISFVAGDKAASIAVFCSLYSLQSLAVNFAFASGNVMVNQAGLKPRLKEQMGSINGAGHMMSSGVRAVGPALTGTLWSVVTASHLHLGVFIPFLLCTLLTLLEIRFYQMV